MSFRQVIVRDASYLSFIGKSLLINEDEHKGIKEVKISIEEIAIIIIENHKSVLSVNLINRCSENNIVIIVCNEKLLPSTLIYPFSGHYRQLENTYLQLDLLKVKKENLWRDIIKNKIKSHIDVIRQTTNDEELITIMYKYQSEVLRNDNSNREAIAAKMFFNSLYGDDFTRFIEDRINNALNYGYSILASTITRNLISFGLDTRFGIWHKSKANAFNLSYDLIEAFRPLIDYYIYKNFDFIDESINIRTRRGLVNILNAEITFNAQRVRVQNAIESYCQNYLNIVRGEVTTLIKVDLSNIILYGE